MKADGLADAIGELEQAFEKWRVLFLAPHVVVGRLAVTPPHATARVAPDTHQRLADHARTHNGCERNLPLSDRDDPYQRYLKAQNILQVLHATL